MFIGYGKGNNFTRKLSFMSLLKYSAEYIILIEVGW